MRARDHEDLLKVLQQRFEANMSRHMGIPWSQVLERIEANPAALKSLHAMETTGGEPDVICKDPLMLKVLFCDCSAESPVGRRNLCYDRQALDARKQNKPSGCVIETAGSIGIELLTEDQYRGLQKLGEFDHRRRVGSRLRLTFAR